MTTAAITPATRLNSFAPSRAADAGLTLRFRRIVILAIFSIFLFTVLLTAVLRGPQGGSPTVHTRPTSTQSPQSSEEYLGAQNG